MPVGYKWNVLSLGPKFIPSVGRNSSVGIATRYGLDGPRIESWREARFSVPVQTGPGAHPASYTMVTGSFPGSKRPEPRVDYPPTSSAEVRERVELYLYSPSGHSWPRTRVSLQSNHTETPTHIEPRTIRPTVVIQQNSRKLLMMDILMSETCWAHKKWNKIASDIKLVFYSSTTSLKKFSNSCRKNSVKLCWAMKHSRGTDASFGIAGSYF